MTPREKLTMRILETQERKLRMPEDKSSQQAFNIKVQAVILIFFVALRPPILCDSDLNIRGAILLLIVIDFGMKGYVTHRSLKLFPETFSDTGRFNAIANNKKSRSKLI